MRRSDLSEPVRARLKGYPHPHDSHYGVVPCPPPFEPISILPVAREHERAVAALARAEAIAAEMADPWLISRILPRREALSSSAIEGTHSTLDELLAIEEDGAGSLDEDAHEAAAQVRGYALGLEAFMPEARARGRAVFDLHLVQALHRLVMKDSRGYADVPGELRQTVVWIGGRDIAYSVYNPAPPEDVPRCLEDSLAFMRGEGREAVHSSLLARMAVSHAHFEAVHPFRDGNGRVGRLLLPLMMAADGHLPLFLSPFIESHRAGYAAALKAAQQREEWHELIGFLADAVCATVDELQATRRALAQLREGWLRRRRFRAGSASLRALDLLMDYPVLTIARLAERLSVSWVQASAAITQLVEARILVERTGHRRNRLFAATEVLALVNRPFGAEPVLAGAGDDPADTGGRR